MAAEAWAALRHRRAQALVVLVFTALVTATAVLSPLSSRALLQSVLGQRIAALPPAARSLAVTSQDLAAPGRVVSPDSLPSFVPPQVRRFLAPPVLALSIEVAATPPGEAPTRLSPVGTLLWQDGACAGVTFSAGRCPAARGEVAVTTAQARLSSWAVGSRIRLTEHTEAEAENGPTRTVVTVVGTYDQVPAPQWFGALLGGRAGTAVQDGGRGMDVLLTPRATVEDPQPTPDGDDEAPWLGLLGSATFGLRPGVGVDEVRALGDPLDAFAGAPAGNTGLPVAARTGLTDVVSALRRDTEQVAVTVPLLVGQLALVLAWVLWIVLSALVQQRRPEVALARLRGRGSRGARRLLLGETLPPVLAGIPLGAALAWGGLEAAAATVLPGSPRPELRAPVVVALAAAGAALLGLAVLSTRRAVREPIVAALRTVPARGGSRLGLLEAVLVAVAVLAYAGLLRGDLTGAGAMAAPALLALGAGVLLARAGGPVAVRAGTWLLARGHAAPAGALLQAGRRPATRWVVPVVTVAVALPVVAVDVLATAQRNGLLRAAAEVGAPLAVETDDHDLTHLRAALARLDPAGATLTPVVLLRPASSTAPTTQAVVPQSFRRVAAAPPELTAAAWDRLDLPAAAPWTIRGTRVGARVSGGPITPQDPGARYQVGLRLVRADAVAVTVPLADVGSRGRADGPATAAVPCRDGCRVVAVVATVPPGQLSTASDFQLSDVTVDDRPQPLPDPAGWHAEPPPPDLVDLGGAAAGALQVRFVRTGAGDVSVLHPSVEAVLPAFVTAPAAPEVAAPDTVRLASGTEGSTVPFRVAGTVRYAPGGPARTTIVNLDALTAAGGRLPGTSRVLVLSARDDPAWRTRLVTSLQADGVPVTRVTRTADVAREYARSAAGWSARLGLVVAVLTVLLAALALVVVAATGRRAVRRDYAALRLGGMAQSTLVTLAVWETVPLALVAGLAGLATGVLGATAVITLVPLFTVPPDADVLDLSFAAGPSLGAGAAALVVMAAVCAASARLSARPPADGVRS